MSFDNESLFLAMVSQIFSISFLFLEYITADRQQTIWGRFPTFSGYSAGANEKQSITGTTQLMFVQNWIISKTLKENVTQVLVWKVMSGCYE